MRLNEKKHGNLAKNIRISLMRARPYGLENTDIALPSMSEQVARQHFAKKV